MRERAAAWDAVVERAYHLGHGPLPAQSEVIGAVNDASGPRDVVVCAAGSMPGDLHKLWRTRDAKGYHVEYGYSCMGYEIAGGLGVKMAAPDREVYVMVGDGSYLMLSSELVTAVQEGIKLIVVLVQNHGFQSIGSLSRSVGVQGFGTRYRYRDPESGQLDGEFLPVDLAANAASLGAQRAARRLGRGAQRGPGRRARGGRHYRHPRGNRPFGAEPGLGGVVGRAGGRGLGAGLGPRGQGGLRGRRALAAPAASPSATR